MGEIVHVAAGQRVDTAHLEKLAVIIALAGTHTAVATANVTRAIATSPTEILSGFEHASDVASDLLLLLYGTHSLGSLAARLTDLVAALTQTAAIYVEAEQTAERQIQQATPGVFSRLFPLHIRGGQAIGFGIAAYLGGWSGFVGNGAATQWGARSAASSLDLSPMSGLYVLPEGFADDRDLTPVQRTAYVLMRLIGNDRFDGDVTLTELDADSFYLGGPDGRAIPPDFDTLIIGGQLPAAAIASAGAALGYSMLTGPTVYEGGRTGRFPNSVAARTDYAIGTLDRLNRESGRRQEQVIQIDTITKPDGTIQHVVFIPGTSAGKGVWGRNPASHDANVNLVAGLDADAQRSVRAAMEAVGIKGGESVAFVGHSQGGITAMNLAASAAMNEKYHVNYVLTAASPVGSQRLPEHVTSLHLEEKNDLVPSLDGAGNHSAPHQVTMTFTADTMTARIGSTHGTEVYAEGMELVQNSVDPDLVRAKHDMSEVFGFDTGAEVRSRSFAAARTVYGADAAPQLVRNRVIHPGIDVLLRR